MLLSLGDIVGVLGAGRSGNGEKSGDVGETHDDDCVVVGEVMC